MDITRGLGLGAYLETLPPVVLDKLYESTWTCQAVLRVLPPLAKLYVMRLLFVDTLTPESVVDTWPTPDAVKKHRLALDKLDRLQLLVRQRAPQSGEFGYSLHTGFQKRLHAAVSGRSGLAQGEVPAGVAAKVPSRAQLDAYATQRWEGLLLFLVEPKGRRPPPAPQEVQAPPLQLEELLREANLIAADKDKSLTETGFQFLLSDTYSQMWQLLRHYISSAGKRSGDELASVISFLLQLGFQQPGQATSLDALTVLERHIAAHMTQLGFLCLFRASGGVWYCPTRRALALAAGPSSETQAEVLEGFIIVESNYRVYAHTASAIKYSILRLFVRCDCILPNLFVGTLTRESIMDALASGITADQIISYLRTHAHPRAALRRPAVPEVVSDQIRLWQAETMRVQHIRSVLYEDFPTPEVFRKSVAFASQLGVLLWQDMEAGRLVCQAGGHEEMRTYIRSIKDQR